MANIAIETLKTKCKEYKIFKQECSDDKEVLSEKNKTLEKMKQELIEHLDDNGLKRFDFGDGSISYSDQFSIKVLDKHAICEWMKKYGYDPLDHMVFNYQTMNSFYRARLDEAKACDNVDFKIDGTGDETTRKILKLNKPKKGLI